MGTPQAPSIGKRLVQLFYPLFTTQLRQYFPTARAESSSQWQKAMMSTILLFPCVVVFVTAVLNCIAMYYDTISAIPLSVILKMAAIWLFVALPLSIVGTIFGRHWMGKSEPPCRVNSIPRWAVCCLRVSVCMHSYIVLLF